MAIAWSFSDLPIASPFVTTAQAQTTRNQAQNLQDKGNQLLLLAAQQHSAGQVREALQTYQAALEIYRVIGDPKRQGDLFHTLGLVYGDLRQYPEAIDAFQQSLPLFSQINDRYRTGASLLNIGVTYLKVREYSKAIDFLQQCLDIVKQSGDQTNEAKKLQGTTLLSLGQVYNQRGEYPKAIDFFQQSLAISKQSGERDVELGSLLNIGTAYNSQGEYQKAIYYFRQSLTFSREISNHGVELSTINNLGTVYNSQGQYQRAIEFFQEALAFSKPIDEGDGEPKQTRDGGTLNNLGTVYSKLGQYQKAIDFYQKAIKSFKQTNDRYGESKSLNNLGVVYEKLEQYQKAIDFYQQSLELKKDNDPNGKGISILNIGNAYVLLKQYRNGINSYMQALDIFSKRVDDPKALASLIISIGIVFKNSGEPSNSIKSYQRSLQIARKIQDPETEILALNNLGAIFDLLNQNELAILYYKQSVNISESIRKNIRGLNKEEQKSYLITIQKAYRNLANLLIKQDRIIEAIQVLDLLKVQELEDYLKNIKGNDRTKQGLRLLPPEANISPQLSTINYQNIPEINRQLANQIQQLPKSEINRVPDYLKQIPKGSVLLYPLILDDRIELILFSPNTTPINRTVKISKQELEALIETFRGDINGQGNDATRKTARKLYEILIRPIEADLVAAKAETILYAPDGALRYIPLAALHDGKQWLAEKYRISNLIAYILTDFTPKPKTQPKVVAGAFGSKRNLDSLDYQARSPMSKRSPVNSPTQLPSSKTTSAAKL